MTTPANLRFIGLWKGDYEDTEWPHPKVFVGPPLRDKAEIRSYLQAGVRIHQDLGYSFCRFEGGPPDEEMGDSDFTDGVWIWPEGLWVYVEQFDVQLPAEFLEHARGMHYRIPEKLDADEMERRSVDKTFWRSWCDRMLSAMSNQFSYVHHALALFSPEAGLDEVTATNLMHDQLKRAAGWRDALTNELTSMLSTDTTDWMLVVDNSKFCMGEFETPDDARKFVKNLLGPFVSNLFER